jgi:hypothetical protein
MGYGFVLSACGRGFDFSDLFLAFRVDTIGF